MNCRSCGSRLEPGEKFCKLCGTPTPDEAPQKETNMDIQMGEDFTLADSVSNDMGVDALVKPQPMQPIMPPVREEPPASTPTVEDLMAPQPMEQQTEVPTPVVEPTPEPVAEPEPTHVVEATTVVESTPNPVVPPVEPVKPIESPKEPKSKSNPLGGLIVVLLLLIIGMLVFQIISNSKQVEEEPKCEEKEVKETKVKYNGFVFNITGDYTYEINNNALYIRDLDNKWVSVVAITPVPYENIKAGRGTVQTNIQKLGYTLSLPEAKTYNSMEFVVAEATKEEEAVLFVYAQANNTNTYVVTIKGEDGKANYEAINDIANVLKTGKYEGGTTTQDVAEAKNALLGLTGIK